MATPARGLYGTKNDSPFLRYAKAVVLVAVVLCVCLYVGRYLTDHVRDMTPDELRDRMASAAGVSTAEAPDASERTLEALPLDLAITQVSRMTPEQRREVMRSGAAQDYLRRLKPEHRRRFVLETVDRGLKDELQKYQKMSPEERKQYVEDARRRQEENREKMDRLPEEEKEKIRKMANSDHVGEALEQASKAFLTLTTSDERAELQPLYDGALDNLQHARSLK